MGIIAGVLIVLAVSGILAHVKSHFVTERAINKIEFDSKEKLVYIRLMNLFKDIQTGKTTFLPRKEFKDDYFHNHKAGSEKKAEIKLQNFVGGFHFASLYVEGNRIVSFDFYPDGRMENIQFHYHFLTKETAPYFKEELEKTMLCYILQKQEKNIYKVDISDSTFLDITTELKSTEDAKTNNLLLSIISLKEEVEKIELSVEDNHDFKTLIDKRLLLLLISYRDMKEEEKSEKKEEFVEALTTIVDKLQKFKEKKQSLNSFEFEKQIRLLKRK